MMMKKSILAGAMAVAMVSGAAQASGHLWNYSGTMTFYDKAGAIGTIDTNVTGAFDMSGMDPAVDGLGSFTTTQTFFGDLWTADVVQFFFYDDILGGTQSHNFSTTEWTYYDAAFTAAKCREVTGSGTCSSPHAVTAGQTSSVIADYSFDLTNAGQFGAGVFFDWSGNPPIPVLSVMQVTNDPMVDGFMQVVSVDTDGDGIPGTKMLTDPFPGQQPSFSGIMTPMVTAVPVPAAVWLLGSGLLGLVGVARRRKAA